MPVESAPNATVNRETSSTSVMLSCLLASGRDKTTKPLGKLAAAGSYMR